jgi:aryl-alcohol dehydrogenase-like predicted oxidoreductase
MDYRPLGTTGLSVSAVCLGTMTFGSQNTEAEAHEQIAVALDHGINFIDTAEMYPVTPTRAETFGRTEEYLGTWIGQSGNRDKIILASKVSGPSRFFPLRGGNRLDRRNIEEAINDSLKRLQTDYLDLYQLHWPDRACRCSADAGCRRSPTRPKPCRWRKAFQVLDDLVKAGKIRAFGVSNETPWGVAEALRLHREKGLPRVASIQNAYNLLNRVFEVGLSEFALREGVGLLAYSPLAAGHLSANIWAAWCRPDRGSMWPNSSPAISP